MLGPQSLRSSTSVRYVNSNRSQASGATQILVFETNRRSRAWTISTALDGIDIECIALFRAGANYLSPHPRVA